MRPDTLAAGVVGALAFGGLVVAARRAAPAWLRAALVLAASAGLVYVLAGRAAALALFGISALLVLGTWRLASTRLWAGWIGALVVVLVAARLPGRQGLTGSQPFGLGPGLWIGLSYLVFRLIHVTVDMHLERVEGVRLPDLLSYALHPASLVAGPIDRVQNAVKAQHSERLSAEDVHQGLWRILVGVFTKFVIANPLYTVVAMHDMARNPDRPTGVAWLWLLATSFYLLADFAAYTDIAIGFGRLAGLRLPENFARPYLSPSMTVFWQRWHITLSFWLRDYIFFPLARALRTRFAPRYRGLIQLVCHVTTMVAAGLWHGLTPGFAVWGLWHGLGLFAASQIAAHQPRRPPGERSAGALLRRAASVGVTFAYVTLGWAFFAADLPTALRIFGRLFGVW